VGLSVSGFHAVDLFTVETGLSMGFLAAFISPWLGGWLAGKIGLFATIFLVAFASLIAALCRFLMKETGPSAHKKKAAVPKRSVSEEPMPVCE
jgi:uncharacterized membrane protein